MIVDPRFHRIHHSLEPRHFDRNFAVCFSFWDSLFGTAYWPKKGEWPAVGVKEYPAPRNFWEYLMLPLGPKEPANARVRRVFPSVTAFCVDAMWASLPLAVGALWATAPLKIREKPPAKPLLILVIGLVFFGLITTPFVFHYMLFQLGDVDLDSQGRLARSVRWASHSKIGLLVMEASHFVAMVCLVWLSYIAIPGAFFKLR